MKGTKSLVASYELELAAVYAIYATTALILYEHLITFEHEVEFLQKRRWSAATWIFMSNRYILLAFAVGSVAPVSSRTCDNALAMGFIQFVTNTMQDVPLHAFTILRSVALVQTRPWKLLTSGILVALGLILVVIDGYEEFTTTWAYVDDSVLGSSCFQIDFSVSADIVQRLETTGAICGIVSAAIALIITLYKTGRQVQQAISLRFATTLSEVLLRDGSLFFLLVAMFHLGQCREITFFKLSLVLLNDIIDSVPAKNSVFSSSAVGTVSNQFLRVLPQILLSRFINNLRQVDSPSSIPSANGHLSQLSIPGFRMPTLAEVMDNLGELMDFTQRKADDDVAEEARECDRDEGADAWMEVRSFDVAGPSGTARSDVDVETAGPSGSGGGSASSGVDVGVMDITGFEIQEELRLSPTLMI